MNHYFGTDGVRGIANIDLTAADALGLATAAAAILGARTSNNIPYRRARAVIARDTRPSGHMLEAAVTAGLTSAGVDVTLIGIAPTPAVAHIVQSTDFDFGVMISASHNPMPDNGIKFFGAQGLKLDDETEKSIEHLWHQHGTASPGITGNSLGTATHDSTHIEAYAHHLLMAWEQFSTPTPGEGQQYQPVRTNFAWENLTIVLDCANGAASTIAPRVLSHTGATIIPISTDLSGENINHHCGSTHLDQLIATTLDNHADIGIAFDGDADRCLAVDNAGNPIDGDLILAVLSQALQRQGKLHRNTLVATVMSNYGLIQHLATLGIQVVTTAVGDKYVLEHMNTENYSLGGEQSGHIILKDYSTTGDGILTALTLISQLQYYSSHELTQAFTKMPQVLVNVPVKDKNVILSSALVIQELTKANTQVAGKGRVLLRPSGTEELFRIMVESNDEQEAHTIAARLADIIQQQSVNI